MKINSLNRRQLMLAGLGAGCAHVSTWAADTFPNKPITFIVPFPAGGPTDHLFRALTALVAKSLGQSFVMDNRPGAFSAIAGGVLSRAKPDGYTVGVLPMTLNRFNLLGTTTLDVGRDFTPIARVAGQTFGIVVKSDSPYRTVADVVKAAKEKPGTINYGTSGIASSTHVGMEEFSRMAGIQLNHIPFKGFAESSVQLLGGQLDLMSEAAAWAPYIENGKMRALCVWNEQRHPQLPNVPTMKELGYDLVMTAPFGIGAPPGLDIQAASKLGEAFKRAVLSNEFKAEAAKILAPVMYQDAVAFRKYIQENFDWEKAMVERLKLKEKIKN